MKLYMAGPYGEALRVNAIGNELSVYGAHYILSTWHVNPLPAEAVDDSVLAAGMWQDIAQLERCEVVVAVTSRGTPRATYSEIGWALARGKSVVWVHGPERAGTNVFAQHGLVQRVQDDGGDLRVLVDAILRAILIVNRGVAA